MYLANWTSNMKIDTFKLKNLLKLKYSCGYYDGFNINLQEKSVISFYRSRAGEGEESTLVCWVVGTFQQPHYPRSGRIG